MSKTIKQAGEDTLLGQAFDITATGLLLTLVMAFIEKRITGQGVVVICCFLAALYIWKLIWPLERFRRYVWWQIFSLIMVGTFSWWLIYTAETQGLAGIVSMFCRNVYRLSLRTPPPMLFCPILRAILPRQVKISNSLPDTQVKSY